VANLKSLGETVEDTRVVKKFLRVVPPRFNQVVVSIEMFCDMKTLTIEELVGRLRAAEDRLDDKVDQIINKGGRLFLAEDWLAKHKHRFQSSSSKEGSIASGSGGQGENKAPNRSDGRGSSRSGVVKLTSKGTPRRKGRCQNCGIYGH
jgi:hypothetical protein